MSEMTDFQQIQRRITQLTAFEDGFWDILLGAIFLSLAIYPVTRERLGPELNIVLFLCVLGLLVVGQLVIRSVVSTPRIGYVEGRRSPKLRLLVIITAGLVLITFGLLALTFFGPGAESISSPIETSGERSYLVEFIAVFVLAGLFSLMAYFFGVRRLYLYGWMVGLGNLASVYMEHNAGWTFFLPLAIVAGIIMLIGSVLLIRFLQKYPVVVEGS